MQNKRGVSQTNDQTPALTSIVAHDKVDVRSEGEGSEVRVTHKVLQGDALHNPRIALKLERNLELVSKTRHRHKDDVWSVTFVPSSTVSSSSAFRARLVGWSVPDVLALFNMTVLDRGAKQPR